MAKRKQSDEATAVEAREITLALPVGDHEQPGYQSQLVEGGDVTIEARGVHLNVQLGRKAADAFVRVRNGLRDSGATLSDGRPVWSNADAMRYIFEEVAESLAAE